MFSSPELIITDVYEDKYHVLIECIGRSPYFCVLHIDNHKIYPVLWIKNNKIYIEKSSISDTIRDNAIKNSTLPPYLLKHRCEYDRTYIYKREITHPYPIQIDVYDANKNKQTIYYAIKQ